MKDYWISNNILIFIILHLLLGIKQLNGHGRLIDPASRSSAWRFGFKTEINYNDNELFCGGFTTQWMTNRGKCGVCGDPYNGKRENEVPDGRYAKKLVITRTYNEGTRIESKVTLTANHNGFFVFKLCPTTNDSKEVTQQCLDRFPLKVLNSESEDKYRVPSNRAQTFSIGLQLPDRLKCNRCVFQWTYTAANNWGKCENGTSAVGCGPQETFRGCADVRIVGLYENLSTSSESPKPTTSEWPDSVSNHIKDVTIISNTSGTHKNRYSEPYHPLTTTYLKPRQTMVTMVSPSRKDPVHLENKCKSTGIWRRVPNMDQWCQTNCAANHCPQSHCVCHKN